MKFKMIHPFTPIAGSLLIGLLTIACSTPTRVETSTENPVNLADTNPRNGVSFPNVGKKTEILPETGFHSLPLNHPWEQTTVVENLDRPWGLAWLPDGTMLITERSGRLRIVRDRVLDPTPVAGLPEILVLGQGGLLDIAVHPRFEENSLIYFTYSQGTREANGVAVGRGQLKGTSLENVEVIFQAGPKKRGGQHFGSRMVWLPDETLLVAIGDGGNPPLKLDGELIRLQAQNRGSYLGKIVRLNADGSIPPDNPWQGDSDKPAVIK